MTLNTCDRNTNQHPSDDFEHLWQVYKTTPIWWLWTPVTGIQNNTHLMTLNTCDRYTKQHPSDDFEHLWQVYKTTPIWWLWTPVTGIQNNTHLTTLNIRDRNKQKYYPSVESEPQCSQKKVICTVRPQTVIPLKWKPYCPKPFSWQPQPFSSVLASCALPEHSHSPPSCQAEDHVSTVISVGMLCIAWAQPLTSELLTCGLCKCSPLTQSASCGSPKQSWLPLSWLVVDHLIRAACELPSCESPDPSCFWVGKMWITWAEPPTSELARCGSPEQSHLPELASCGSPEQSHLPLSWQDVDHLSRATYLSWLVVDHLSRATYLWVGKLWITSAEPLISEFASCGSPEQNRFWVGYL